MFSQTTHPTDFSAWYTNDNLKKLVYSAQKHTPCCRYVFSYSGDSNPYQTFMHQFKSLITLQHKLQTPVYFISMRPGAVQSSHFMVGALIEDQLIIINPLGDESKQDFYKVIFKIRERGLVKSVSISKTVIQNDVGGIVSCGPICVELMHHLASLPKELIVRMAEGKLKTKPLVFSEEELEAYALTIAEETLRYRSIDISSDLPECLKPLLTSPAGQYQTQLQGIRQRHEILLRQLQVEWPLEQTLMFKMLNQGLTEIEQEKEFLALKTELERLKEGQPMRGVKPISASASNLLSGNRQPLPPNPLSPIQEELGRILSVMRSLNISQNTDTGTANESEGSIVRLAPPPVQPVDANPERSLEVFRGYWQGEPKFRRLLERNGLIATEVSGAGLDCFINSLLQQAKQQYDIPAFGPEFIKRIKIQAGLGPAAVMRYDDTPEALAILKAINEICGVNLEVHFIQINQAGQPIVLPPLVDDTLQGPMQPVVIWQQPGHYVAIASRKLMSLCRNVPERPPEPRQINQNNTEAIPLSHIPYNREELQEMVVELPLAPEIVTKVTAYLDNIEGQVSEIRKYQSKRKPENFYEPMRTAVLEIRNTAKDLYELTKSYHPSFPNQIRQVILNWITPLETELERCVEMSVSERNALELKTKHLYAEQSFVSRQPDLQKALMQYLDSLKSLLSKPGKSAPRCYISYAWPSLENKEKEYWIQPFLYVLYDHLTAVGIRVVMDIRDNKPGESIYQFMKQYHEGNYIILVGTESLLQKHYAVIPHAVQTELSIVSNRTEKDQKQFGQSRIYPMLISGTLKSAYSERYQLYSTVRDAREQGYLGTLKKLTDWIYEHRVNAVQLEYARLWRAFNDTCPGLPKALEAAETEIAIGYHRQRLDYLRQDIQYKSVEAQEKIQHSQAVQVEQISVLIKSQGINPQTLFDENGQQFQRPYSNPNFIERPGLWDKMVQHFAQSDQQIFTLTAHGLGGMGKTELAGYYYLHPPRPYALRAWFHASSKENVYLQYIKLAEKNGTVFLESAPIEKKVKQIKMWLESQKDCLLVYDDVTNSQELEGLLPEKGKHHILITSRNSIAWPSHQTLNVDVMEENEAINLIFKITGFEKNEAQLKDLVKILGYLPLALAQAGAYMAETKTSIETYLELYKKHQANLLKKKDLERDLRHEPVWTTFDVNFEALKLSCPTALLTLKQASWLSSSKIPEILLEAMLPTEELLWPAIKKQIGRYSLMRVQVEQKQLSIHPLLQEILQDKQKPEQLTGDLSKTFNLLLKTIYNISSNKIQYDNDEMKMKSFLPHLQSLVNHYDLLWPKNPTLELALILRKIGDVLFYVMTDKSSLGFYERALTIIENCNNLDKNLELETAITLLGVGNAYGDLGRGKDKERILRKSLEIFKRHNSNGKYNKDIAATMVPLGLVCLLDTGKIEEGKALIEEGIKVYEKIGDIEIAHLMKVFLGKACIDLGNPEEGKKILDETIKVLKPGKNSLYISSAQINLGEAELELGNIEVAGNLLKSGLDYLKERYGEEHFNVARSEPILAKIYLKQKKYEEALILLEHALRVKEKDFGQGHIKVAKILVVLGDAYICKGNIEKAIDILNRALRIQESYYKKDSVIVGKTQTRLGIAYVKLGNREALKQAKDLLEQAQPSLKEFYQNKQNQFEYRENLSYLVKVSGLIKNLEDDIITNNNGSAPLIFSQTTSDQLSINSSNPKFWNCSKLAIGVFTIGAVAIATTVALNCKTL